MDKGNGKMAVALGSGWPEREYKKDFAVCGECYHEMLDHAFRNNLILECQKYLCGCIIMPPAPKERNRM